VLAAAVTVAAAMAPWVGAVLATALGGYAPMFWVMAVVGMVAALLGLGSMPDLSSQESVRDRIAER
jgi:MFS family permease